jgi:acyl-CoA thioesterase FadM
MRVRRPSGGINSKHHGAESRYAIEPKSAAIVNGAAVMVRTLGCGLDVLRRLRIGPVVLEDRLVYRKELVLLETFEVGLAVAALTRDARRMKLRNAFRRDRDGAHVATVESVVIWLDLEARRPVVPPRELAAPWLTLARTPDFEWFEDAPHANSG